MKVRILIVLPCLLFVTSLFVIPAYATPSDPPQSTASLLSLADPTIISVTCSSPTLYYCYSTGYILDVSSSLLSPTNKAVLFPFYNPNVGFMRSYYVFYSGLLAADGKFPQGTGVRLTTEPNYSSNSVDIQFDYVVSLGYSGYLYSLEYESGGTTSFYMYPGLLRNDLLTNDEFVTSPAGWPPSSCSFTLSYYDSVGVKHVLASKSGVSFIPNVQNLFPIVVDDYVTDLIIEFSTTLAHNTVGFGPYAGIDRYVVTTIAGLDPLLLAFNPPDTFFLSRIWNALLDILSSVGSHIGQSVDAILSSIGNAVGSTLNNILSAIHQLSLGWQAPPDRGAEASQFVGDIGDVSGDIDSANDAIESLIPRPPPDSVLSTLPPDFVAPVDQSVVTMKESVTDIMSNQLVLSMLLIVFTVALGRYILFGKSDS